MRPDFLRNPAGRHRRFALRRLAVAGFCLFLGACGVAQTPLLRDGKPYGVTPGPFRDKWWNFYQRGISFADGGFYTEASEDFAEAVRRRDEDQWRTRTYGMHFLDYFPHRELGILHYREQRHEEAIRELEASLSSANSAKAAYFLNRARAALLERTGRDRQPPALHLAGPRNGAITNEFHTTISGAATDDQFVSGVSVSGAPLFLEQSVERFEFETRVPLHEGRNEIRLRATDLTGKEAAESLTVIADRRGPVITIGDLHRTGTKRRLTGYITDDTGVVRYSINGKETAGDPKREIVLAEDLPPGPVRIEAEDRAGNVTVAEVSRVQKASLPSVWPRFASLGSRLPAGRRSRHTGPRRNWLSSIGPSIFDNTPPAITLRELPPPQETFHDRVLVAGSVSDATGVASLTVNGVPVLRREGKAVFFSHLLGLEVGPNRVVVETTDSRGNTRTREVMVERKVPEIRQLGSRMSIALLTLEHRGDASVTGAAVDDRLGNAFVAQRRFNLVERERIREILTELGLSGSRLADPAAAPRVGRIVAADAVLAGSVLETARSIEVVTHLVDTESGVILASEDAFDEENSLAAVHLLTERLAFKYQRDFPLLEGRVIEVSGRDLLVDFGGEHGLKPHRKLLLFRTTPQPASPPPGDSSGSGPLLLGEARVGTVFPDSAQASATRQDREFRARDGVLTK